MGSTIRQSPNSTSRPNSSGTIKSNRSDLNSDVKTKRKSKNKSATNRTLELRLPPKNLTKHEEIVIKLNENKSTYSSCSRENTNGTLFGVAEININKKRSSTRSDKPEREMIVKIRNIHQTLSALETNLKLSRALQAEQCLRYSTLKTHSTAVLEDLKKANKRNKNMLNLFRQSVTDLRFGNCDALPESLKREVQHSWHQKYDALLGQNKQLRKDLTSANTVINEKDKRIEGLEQKLLNLADTLVEREEDVKNMCTKYLKLKKRKDEQETLLKSSIETLQDELQKTKEASSMTAKGSEMSLRPSKDALLEREIRRSDRLTYENSLLRMQLLEAKRGCKSSRSSSTMSSQKNL